MAIKSKEDLLSAIKTRLGEDTSDDALSLIEDISDTVSDLENKAKGDGKDWKAEAERIDKEWREKYRDRFFNGASEDEDENDDYNGSAFAPKKQYRFEDLFKEM